MLKHILALSVLALVASTTPLIGQSKKAKKNPCAGPGEVCSNNQEIYCSNGLTCIDPFTGRPAGEGRCQVYRKHLSSLAKPGKFEEPARCSSKTLDPLLRSGWSLSSSARLVW